MTLCVETYLWPRGGWNGDGRLEVTEDPITRYPLACSHRRRDLTLRLELVRESVELRLRAADVPVVCPACRADSARNDMSESKVYHDGSRRLQDRFDTRRLADRMEEVIVHDVFTDAERAFIESRAMFFLATADAQGRPDCSYKGGRPGFVRVVGPATLAFPSYDGNGMFTQPRQHPRQPARRAAFVDFESPKRLRVNGQASVHEDDPLLGRARRCPARRARAGGRGLPQLPALHPPDELVEESSYAPCEGTRRRCRSGRRARCSVRCCRPPTPPTEALDDARRGSWRWRLAALLAAGCAGRMASAGSGRPAVQRGRGGDPRAAEGDAPRGA